MCEKCSYESDDILKISVCEKRNHEVPQSSLFEPITKEIIEGFRSRLDSLRSRDKKLYIDSGPVALFNALYVLYVKGHFTTLQAALSTIENFYKAVDESK